MHVIADVPAEDAGMGLPLHLVASLPHRRYAPGWRFRAPAVALAGFPGLATGQSRSTRHGQSSSFTALRFFGSLFAFLWERAAVTGRSYASFIRVFCF